MILVFPKLFLKRIIEITDEVISQRVSKSKTDKDNMIKTLEKNKQKGKILLQQLNTVRRS